MVKPIETVEKRYTSIWREHDFRLFWLGSVISETGTLVTGVILPILIFRLTNDPFLTALVGAFRVVPYLVFGLIAGVVADRLNRRKLMITCDVINAALLGSLPLAALFNLLTLPHIYLVALVSASIFVWFDAANWGALPSLVGRYRIVAANSALSSAAILSEIFAPIIAGILASFIDPAMVISLDAVSYLVSAFCLASIKIPFNVVRELNSTIATSSKAVKRAFSEIKEGLQFIWQNRVVRVLTLTGFGNSFTGGAIIGLLVVYGVRNLGLAQNDFRLGFLYSSGAVGSLIISLGFPLLVRRIPIGFISLLGLTINPLMVLGMIISGNFVIGCLFYLGWNICYQLVIINGITVRQKITPEHLLSRVNTTARMVAWGGTPFGAAIGGGLVALTGVGFAFLIMCSGVLISAVVAWFSPLKHPSSIEIETNSDPLIMQVK